MPCTGDLGLSVVVLLLDDMRADQLPFLTESSAWMADHAVVFDEAYVTVPMCCPERASFLSGGFLPQSTGVITNEAPRGGATTFPDTDTLATRLQSAGYRTHLNGKYLNEYDELGLYVPPGWTDWAAIAEGQPWDGFTIVGGASGPDAPGEGQAIAVSGYVTDWQGAVTARFVQESGESPFFAYVSFRSPHDPHLPAAEDVGSFAGTVWHVGAFNEADLSDKPAWIQALPLWTDEEIAASDVENVARLETLPSVDRAIVTVLESLRDSGRLDDTVVVITSDNGQQWGEHRLDEKGVGYQESVHMPLVVYNPALTPRHTSALVAANLDLAATVTALAGLPPRGDGESLLPVLCDGEDELRDVVPLQGWPYTEPPWAGVVTHDWKYLETATGELELYDLAADPAEAESVAADPARAATIAELHAALEPFRGLAITTALVDDAVVGTPYRVSLGAWGGTPPYRWSFAYGEAPAGLTLAEDGALSGTPTEVTNAEFTLRVDDASVSPYDGRPQSDQRKFRLEVRKPAAEPDPEPDCGCGAPGAPGLVLVAGAVAALRRRRA